MAIAHPTIIEILNKVQMPYKISSPTLLLACRALESSGQRVAQQTQSQIRINRAGLTDALKDPLLSRVGIGQPVGGCAANFVVVPILEPGTERACDSRAKLIVARLKEGYGISLRYIGGQAGCAGCVRITVGTGPDIDALIQALKIVAAE